MLACENNHKPQLHLNSSFDFLFYFFYRSGLKSATVKKIRAMNKREKETSVYCFVFNIYGLPLARALPKTVIKNPTPFVVMK